MLRPRLLNGIDHFFSRKICSCPSEWMLLSLRCHKAKWAIQFILRLESILSARKSIIKCGNYDYEWPGSMCVCSFILVCRHFFLRIDFRENVLISSGILDLWFWVMSWVLAILLFFCDENDDHLLENWMPLESGRNEVTHFARQCPRPSCSLPFPAKAHRIDRWSLECECHELCQSETTASSMRKKKVVCLTTTTNNQYIQVLSLRRPVFF